MHVPAAGFLVGLETGPLWRPGGAIPVQTQVGRSRAHPSAGLFRRATAAGPAMNPVIGILAMLKPALVAEVRRLLAEGKLSQRAIARRLGVSRGSVHAIARGKRPDRQPAEPLDEVRWEGPPARCPGCGGLVFLPCRACATRRAMARRRRPPWPDTDEPLALQLADEHRRRYEEVRMWRQMRLEAGQPPASGGAPRAEPPPGQAVLPARPGR